MKEKKNTKKMVNYLNKIKKIPKSKKIILYFILILIFFINSYSTFATPCGVNSPQIATCTSSCSGFDPDRQLDGRSSECFADPLNQICCCPSGYVADSNNVKCIINGVCGTSNEGLFSSQPTSNLCSYGTASPVTTLSTSYTWSCYGAEGGSTASCSANRIVNGLCGTANGKTYSYTDTSWGSYTFCSLGNPNPLNPAFPAEGSSTSWQCQGLNGGTTANCLASRASCTPSYFNNCDSTDGCGGTRTTSPYNSCDLTSNTICGAESNCNDGIDNDCDNEKDWDTLGIRGPEKGDNNCPVSITGEVGIGNTNPCPNTNIDVYCTSSVADVNSIDDYIGTNKCTWISWINYAAKFTCNVGADNSGASVKKIVKCTVDLAKSYAGTQESTKEITVKSSSDPSCGCGQYTTSTNCINDPQARCQWCDQCSGVKYSGAGNRCVNKGACTYTCNKAYCGATCDSSVSGCDLNSCCITEAQACTGTAGSTGNCCQTTASHCDYGLDGELSQGYCCVDGYYYDGSTCKPRQACALTCLYEPSQLAYYSTIPECVATNARTSCCTTINGGGGNQKFHEHYECKFEGTNTWVNC